jgi:CubicO group peptidase (beta-lactamase class C family)
MTVNTRKFLLTVCLFGLSLVACAQPIPPSTPVDEPSPSVKTELGSIDAQVDERIRTLIEQADIPSLSVGIVVDHELIWAKNYGGPAGLDTVYVVGSIQKPFTSSAVLQLVEQGVLDLDEDVSAYLPFSVRHPGYPDTPITIRALLSHQSGLGGTSLYEDLYRYGGDYALYEFGEDLLGIEFPRFDSYPTPDTFYEGLLTPGGVYHTPDVWEFEPGTVHYSNIAYQFLGYLVEHVTGQPLAAYLADHVMEPLDMTHSGYRVSDLVEHHARPYERVEADYLVMDGEEVPMREGYESVVSGNLLELPLYEYSPGAGGLRTTVPDLAQFMIAQMNRGLAPNGFQLLQPETVDMMHQIAGRAQGNINSFELVGQGMGWSVCEDGVEGHVGGQMGFGGTMISKRSDGRTFGILMMTNVAATFLEEERRINWYTSYYFELEQFLLQTAEQMAAQGVEN